MVGAVLATALGALALPAQAASLPTAAATRQPGAAGAGHLSPQQNASAQARKTGRPTAVPQLDNATQTTLANPDGSFTVSTTALPTRVYRGGKWVTIDTTLRRNDDGSYTPTAVASDLTISGGGHQPLASILSNGQHLSVSWPTTLPVPTVSGDTATYADVLPDVDLKVTATDQGGIDEVLVVKNAAAARNPALKALALTTSGPGLTLHNDADGSLAALTAGGATAFYAPAPQMWDSSGAGAGATSTSPSQSTGSGAASAPGATFRGPGAASHRARIATRLKGKTVALVPDAGMLTSSADRYPLYLDPSWSPSTKPGYYEAQEGCAGSANSFDNTTYEPDGDGVGYNGWSGCLGTERTYFQFTLPSTVYGTDIISATLKAVESASSSASLSTGVSVYQAKSAISKASDWTNRPALNASPLDTKTVGPVTTSTQPSVGWSVKSAVTPAKKGATLTFGLVEDDKGSDRDYLKRFFVTGAQTTPSIVINYNTKPHIVSAYTAPGTTCTAASPFSTIGNTAVTLKAQVGDPDSGSTMTAHFAYGHYSGTQIGSSTTTQHAGNNGVLSWNIGTLPSGQYTWTVYANDGTDSSATTTCHFTVDATAPKSPVLASTVFPSDDQEPTTDNPGRLTGGSGDFTFAPNGSTDVAKYAYAWGTEPPTVNPPDTVTAAGGAATTTATLTPPSTGLNVLYVRAVDSAGNVSTTASSLDVWTQYSSTPQVAADGDFNDDGTPDVITVGTAANPGLWLYEGNSDSSGHPNGTLAAPLQIGDKGIVNGTGKATDWNGAVITHGQFTGSPEGDQDLMVRTADGAVTVYPGSGDTGDDSTFDPAGSDIAQPVDVSISPADGQSTTPVPDWFQDQQLVAVGALQSDDATGAWLYPNTFGLSPDLWAIQGDALGYYPSTTTSETYNPFTVLSPSGWQGKTIVDAGVIGGFPALWSRDTTTGELDLWTTTDPNIAPGAVGSTKTVMAASGYAAGDYSMLASAGDNGPSGCPELWGVATSTGKVTFIPCSSPTALAATADSGATAGTAAALDATTAASFAGGTVTAQLAGDFNGDGKPDIAHLYDYGHGHLAVEDELADPSGSGTFGQSQLVWDGPTAGVDTGYVYAAAGDFNGDGKSDIALFYNYTTGTVHDAVQVLTADSNGDNGFSAPVTVWSSTSWGNGTTMMSAGDFNGDGKTDLSLYYDYVAQAPTLFTLTTDTNGDGGITPPVRQSSGL